jgi:transposase InsO family protein
VTRNLEIYCLSDGIKVLSGAIGLGLWVKYPKWQGKATQSGTREFPNLLVEKDVAGINKVWQADMAHYLCGNRKLYTLYITDVYSQEIVGHGAYNSNIGENYVQAMKEAIAKMQRFKKLFGLIHHSDRRKQYECREYIKLCEKNKIEQSICMYS